MRIDLTDDQAAMVRDAIMQAKGLDGRAVNAIADLFTPAPSVTAEVREHVYRFLVMRGGSVLDLCETREAADERVKSWERLHRQGYPAVTVVELAEEAAEREDLLTCPECGETTFGYLENCQDYRTPGEQKGDAEGGYVSVFWHSDGTAESGDSDPGLFCDNYQGGGCGIAIDLPDGWEIEYE